MTRIWSFVFCLYVCFVAAASQRRWCTHCNCSNTRVTPHAQGGEIYHSQYYGNNTRRGCTWTRSAQLNQVVLLYFLFLNLRYDENCRRDQLTIHDGPGTISTVKETFCGARRPEPILSSGRSVTLKISTDGSNYNRRFHLLYFFIDQDRTCSGTQYLSGNTGVIVSHPTATIKDYEKFLNCKWVINGQYGKIVRLFFEKFALENSVRCGYDSLTVYDGQDEDSRILAKLCGSDQPKTISSTGQTLMLKFRSDSTNGYKGFRLRYQIVNANEICPLTTVQLSDTRGIIRSPEWQNGIANSKKADCSWTVTGVSRKVVRLRFTRFRVNRCSGCSCGRLTIHDGPGLSSRVLKKFCGQELPRDVVSNGRSVTLNFKGKFFRRDDGFTINYEVVDRFSSSRRVIGKVTPSVLVASEQDTVKNLGYNRQSDAITPKTIE